MKAREPASPLAFWDGRMRWSPPPIGPLRHRLPHPWAQQLNGKEVLTCPKVRPRIPAGVDATEVGLLGGRQRQTAPRRRPCRRQRNARSGEPRIQARVSRVRGRARSGRPGCERLRIQRSSAQLGCRRHHRWRRTRIGTRSGFPPVPSRGLPPPCLSARSARSTSRRRHLKSWPRWKRMA